MNLLRGTSLLVFVIYLCHVLRGLTSVYFVVLGMSVVLFFSAFGWQFRKCRIDLSVLVAVFCWVYASLLTLLYGQFYGDPLVGIFRLWASLPLAFVAIVLAETSIALPMRFLSIFFVLAASTFPVQFVIGPIEWFAESSERAGGARFASLAGNLTAYGVVVGIPALAAFYYFRRRIGVGVFLVLALGALLSLQKAALANMFLAVIFAVWLGVLRARTLALYLPALFLIGAIVAMQMDFESGAVGSAWRYVKGIITSDSDLSDDVSFVVSIVDRITVLPAEALAFYDPQWLVFGVGAFGGAGALGYSDLPMAHNGLVELILIFGCGFGGAMAVFLFVYFIKMSAVLLSRRRVAGTELGFVCAAYIMWFVNYLFSGGGIFHPIGGAIFWLLLIRFRKLIKIEKNSSCDVKRLELSPSH